MDKPNKKFIFSVIIISLIFTLIDALFHLSFEALEVYSYALPNFLFSLHLPASFWYAIGKFIGTTIIGLIVLIVLSKTNLKGKIKTTVFTVIIIVLLEFRYYISRDYSNSWHAYNMAVHFIVLLVISHFIFKKYNLNN